MQRVLYRQKDEGGSLTIDASLLEDGSVEIFFYDIGPFAKKHHGDVDLEMSLKIPQDQLGRLSVSLLADRFEGSIDALSAIEKYCERNEIETTAWSF
jgi:hypothetical protein